MRLHVDTKASSRVSVLVRSRAVHLCRVSPSQARMRRPAQAAAVSGGARPQSSARPGREAPARAFL